MKRFLLIALCAITMTPLKAVNYCASSSWGYAGNAVTGGGNATPTLVTNETQLKNALKSSNQVIILTQNITVTNHISSDKSNLTIMALPGVQLISQQRDQSTSGILYLKGSNIILRNLTLKGPGAYDCDGWDLLCLDNAQNVWVDHCDFQDGVDDNFDIKANADNITVSWCRFRYLIEPKAGGLETDDHRFSNLIGSSASQKPEDGTYNVTYAHCWWDEGCVGRMVRCRNAELHFLNCYWNSSVSSTYVGPERASAYFEGCTFDGRAVTLGHVFQSYNNTEEYNFCKFVHCEGHNTANYGSVSAPAYSYDHLTAADALTYTTNATCGAGATLLVTTSGEVTSSCAEEPEDPSDPEEPEGESIFWNFSDADFVALLGDIQSETIVRDLHIAATSDKKVTIAESSKSCDNIDFTHCLKFNGSGSETARHICFNVSGSCTITIYLASAKSTETRTLNIAANTFSNVAGTMSAGSSVTKETYSYTGNAATIYLYSANSGINIYGIKLTYPEVPSAIGEIDAGSANTPCTKILRNGEIFILRGNKLYTLTGAEVTP